LTDFSGGAGLTKICDRAFALCPLSTLSIPAKVTQIGLGAYKLCTPSAVVFETAGALPTISYEKTATRLENSEYRTMVFSDIQTAVVPDSSVELDGTVLDPQYPGFRGLTIAFAGSSDSGKAILVQCTLQPDEQTGLVNVPSSVKVNDQTYEIISALPNAFSNYEDFDSWGEGKLTDILLPPSLGSISDYEDGLALETVDQKLSGAEETGTETEEQSGTADTETQSSQSDTQATESNQTGASDDSAAASETEPDIVTVDLSSGYNDAASITAVCLDDTEKYTLYVSKDEESQNELTNAVADAYGTPTKGQLLMVDLTMVEQKSKVPISYFGEYPVQISIPISDTMADQNICAVTMGEDGALQTIYGTKEKKDDKNYFTFQTNHFSTYGIYAGIGEMSEQIATESAKLLQKDDSPETGDSFQPKWILVIGCLLLGAALLLKKHPQ
jgi:hypothetical protein